MKIYKMLDKLQIINQNDDTIKDEEEIKKILNSQNDINITMENNIPMKKQLKHFTNKFYASANKKCSNCGIENQSTYYQYNTQAYFLCVDCFSKNKYPPNFDDDRFIKITPEETWSSSETHNLLEAIRLYNDNWQLISKYVGKSIDDCINHFITLPIEDPFVQKIDQNEKNKASTVLLLFIYLFIFLLLCNSLNLC